MGIFGRLVEQRNRWPIPELGTLAAHGARTLMRELFGDLLTEEELHRRSSATAKLKAEMGARTVQKAIADGDTNQLLRGEAIIMKAVCDVDDAGTDTVPTEVADAVTDIAVTFAVIEPTNPYISPNTAHRVLAILENQAESPEIP